MAHRTDTQVVVRIAGKETPNDWELDELEVREFLDRPYRARARLSTDEPGLPTEALLGARIEITVDVGGRHEYRVTGIVLASAYERTFRSKVYVRLGIGPAIGLLELQQHTRTFSESSVLEILSQVVAKPFLEFGGAVDIRQLERVYEPRDYSVQWEETDLAFILRLFAEAGIFWRFDHSGAEEVAILLDNSASLRPIGPDPVLPFDPSGRAGEPSVLRFTRGLRVQPKEYRATQWDWKSQPPTIFEASRGDPAAPKGGKDSYALAFGRRERFGDERLREAKAGTGPHLDRTEAIIHDTALRDSLDASNVRGESDVPELRAGFTFSVLGHPNLELEQEHYLTFVLHTFVRKEDFEGGSVGVHYRNEFCAQPLERPYRPPTRVAPRIHGPETAVVVARADETQFTDSFGRVRVRFHWAEPESSCWIRVAQAWAGAGYGTFFLPRPGMEVIVSFLGGDPERPLITGCVYNGLNRPPYDVPEHSTISTVRSQSFPHDEGYNELRFDDAAGHEQVVLRAERRMDVCVKSSLLETIGGHREVRIGSKTVGGLNTWIHHDRNSFVQENVYQEVGLDCHRLVVGDAMDRVDGDRRVSTGKRHSVEAEAILHQASQSISHRTTQVLVEGTEDVSLRGAFIHAEATHRLCLKAGPNYITIDPIAGIFIQGNLTSINSGGPEEPAQTAQAVEGFELLKPIEALHASCKVPGSRHGSATHARPSRDHTRIRVDPHEPSPYPPGPFSPPPPDPRRPDFKTCAITKFTAICEHGRSTTGGVLDVVPTNAAGDRVHFLVEDNGLCAGEPVWEVFGRGKLPPGYTTSFLAVPGSTPAPRWPPPRRDHDFAEQTLVMVRPSGGIPHTKTISCFPANTLQFERPFSTAKIINDLIQRVLSIPILKTVLDFVVEIDTLKLTEKDDRVLAFAVFKEFSDHRAYFHYDLEVHLHAEAEGVIGLNLARFIKFAVSAVHGGAKLLARLDEIFSGFGSSLDNVLSFVPGAGAVLGAKLDVDLEAHRHRPDEPRIQDTPNGTVEFDTVIGFDGRLTIPALSTIISPWELIFGSTPPALKLVVKGKLLFARELRPKLGEDTFVLAGFIEFTGIRFDELIINVGKVDLVKEVLGIEKVPFDAPAPPSDRSDRRIEFEIDLSEILELLRQGNDA